MKNLNKAYRNPRFLIYKTLFLIALAVYFTGCSGSEDTAANPGPYTCQNLAGNYLEHPFGTTTLSLNANCTFTDSYCGYDANIAFADSVSGFATVTVNGTNGAPGCMASIAHACQVEVNGLLLGIDCGGSNLFLFSRVL